jgi:hypothetical protein
MHYLSFAVFGASTAHGVLAGSDSAEPWVMAMYLVAAGSVLALTAYRVVLAAGSSGARGVRGASAP